MASADIDGFDRREGRVGMAEGGLFFEVLALDQAAMRAFYEAVFGWSMEPGPSGFDYVALRPPLAVRGGVGQAVPGQPGQAPGANFYVMVDDIDAALLRVTDAGGSVLLPRTEVDGYAFAMFHDPEGNTVGVVAPFPPDGVVPAELRDGDRS